MSRTFNDDVTDALGELARRQGLNGTQRTIVLTAAARPGLSVGAVATIAGITIETARSKRIPGYVPYLEELGLVEVFTNAGGTPCLRPGPTITKETSNA